VGCLNPKIVSGQSALITAIVDRGQGTGRLLVAARLLWVPRSELGMPTWLHFRTPPSTIIIFNDKPSTLEPCITFSPTAQRNPTDRHPSNSQQD
jgi:hypothetical protein